MHLVHWDTTFVIVDESETGTTNYYRKKSIPYVSNPIAAATTMMKLKAADSTTPKSITAYFSPKMPPDMGNIQGTKKVQARMARKQSKTTQTPNNTTALHHKSPMILEHYQAMAKEISPSCTTTTTNKQNIEDPSDPYQIKQQGNDR